MSIDEHRTKFDLSNIPERLFQSYLETIGDYMVCGEGIWWYIDACKNEFIFYDSCKDKETHNAGPELHDFSKSTLGDVLDHVKSSWQKCIDQQATLPLKNVAIYNSQGGKKFY